MLAVAAVLWLLALGALVFLAAHISRPVQRLTQGLSSVAAGDLSTRVPPGGGDEIGAALEAFNHMAGQLQQARERLIHLTRLAAWQALAHKMAHEVKNSLTPIRLTMEEIVSRRGAVDDTFLGQASQIVADEVNTLERRVRAFSEFASEPPVSPSEIDVNAMVEERVSFLKSAHPEVNYQLRLTPGRPSAVADPDLIKGVLTNLLENAAEAARPIGAKAGGTVMVATTVEGETVAVEVHDSGPGLSAQARSTLFEPSISFKKGGMGLGLSIARRSAVLCGGELETLESELGGAAFLPDFNFPSVGEKNLEYSSFTLASIAESRAASCAPTELRIDSITLEASGGRLRSPCVVHSTWASPQDSRFADRGLSDSVCNSSRRNSSALSPCAKDVQLSPSRVSTCAEAPSRKRFRTR